MKDPLSYTYDALERELNLVEIHFKEAPKGDKDFCEDCINKHIQTIRGLALEGSGFTKSKSEQERFLKVEKEINKIKGQDYKKYGVEFAQKVRQLRKYLSTCSVCSLTKDLNNIPSYNNNTHNSGRISDQPQLNGEPKKNMAKYTELMYMGVGQLAAEGVRYVVEIYKPTWKNYVQLGGGAFLTLLPMFTKKLPNSVKTISVVAGTNLLANGIVGFVKGAITPGVRAGVVRAGNGVVRASSNNGAMRFGLSNGRQFGGMVTTQNVPTTYARAGILAGAQAFEAPEHADLIRVD